MAATYQPSQPLVTYPSEHRVVAVNDGYQTLADTIGAQGGAKQGLCPEG